VNEAQTLNLKLNWNWYLKNSLGQHNCDLLLTDDLLSLSDEAFKDDVDTLNDNI